jgi:RNA polymerase sigma-70 factor (ECF subfamily)
MTEVDFEGLYERYAADVLHFALYLCGDRHEAEEIVAETFVRAWIATGKIRTATVKAYLLSIARNLHIERYRRTSRLTDLPAEIADPGVDPARAAESRDELYAVSRALQRVPDPDRSALLMRARDVSYEDIAAALGLTPGAVRVKVHRARVKLASLGFGRS